MAVFCLAFIPEGQAEEYDFSRHERLREEAVRASLNSLEEANAALQRLESASPVIEVDEPSSQQAAAPAPETSVPVPPMKEPPKGIKAVPPLLEKPGVKLSGEFRTSTGFYSNGDVVFTRANPDLNERSWRLLSHDALNRGQNTFDPALYTRLKLVMDAVVASSVSWAVDLHLNVTNDPWSWTGKTKEVEVTSAFGDIAKVRYLTWGATPYTINQIYYTSRYGNSFALPELKPANGIVPTVSVKGGFFPNDTFNIPPLKVEHTYFPLREAWVDVKADKVAKLRIFPMGYENQALTSDDPLGLSNHRQWWEESPWLWSWKQGILNVGANPVDFIKGEWDRSLSFFTRDSDGTHLTALRGVSLDFTPSEQTSVKATVASPKTLWQNYDVVNAVPASVRAKHFVTDSFYIGTTANAHQGFVNGGELDAENYAGGVDAGFTPVENVKVSGQYAVSRSRYDQTTPAYATKKQGNAYYGSIMASNNEYDLLRKDYFGVTPYVPKQSFYKTRVYYARMDENFESTLSNYHSTRRDEFWSRHLSFYPSNYRYLPGTKPPLTEHDLAPFAIGDGIDYGRQAMGWRGDVNLLQGRLRGLADVRHVQTVNSEPVETVARTQWTASPTDKLTAKALFVDTELPKTTEGVDPFIYDGNTGKYFLNNEVRGGENPSVRTGSLGARYQLTGWAAVNGVWEYTNDFTLATNNFPRGVLNSAVLGDVYTQDGRLYRANLPFLYDQGYFDMPPYDYHNIFKGGIEINPSPIWHIYLDYTRNPYKFAGNIDDNMNHWGIETSIVPTRRFGIFARYTYSRWYDLERLVFDDTLDYKGYHNVFLEARLLLKHDDMFSLLYGVGPAYNVSTSATDPTLTYYATTVLETQHLVRMMYQKKF